MDHEDKNYLFITIFLVILMIISSYRIPEGTIGFIIIYGMIIILFGLFNIIEFEPDNERIV